MPITIDTSNPQRQLEKIHQEFLDLLAKESTLQAERNEAARSAVANGVSVTHLAKAGGISRELLHRILRASPASPPELAHVMPTVKARGSRL